MIGDDEPPPPPQGDAPAPPAGNPNQQQAPAPPPGQTTSSTSTEGDSLERGMDSVIGQAENVARDAASAAKEAGEAKQNITDPDQDTADKGSNIGHEGADALRALGLNDAANALDSATDDVFGKTEAPSQLPPIRYRVFFGKKTDLMSGLESMGESLLGDAMSAGDSLIEAGADAIGAGKYLGDDPMSSMLERFSPFKEDPAELDAAESIWKLGRIDVEEGLNVVWRCELLLYTDEIRDPDLESALDAQATSGGLVDQIAGPIKSAIDTFNTLKDTFDDTSNESEADEAEADNAALQAAEDELAYVRDEIKQLEEDLAAAQAESPQDAQKIAYLQKRLTDARAHERAAITKVQTARTAAAKSRAKARDDRSPLGDRVSGIKGAIDRLKSPKDALDAIGAATDLVFGGAKKGYPDAPVFVNVPLDPADFLGQTVSVRVSREFLGPTGTASDQVNYPYSARYLTGVVVEMRDLGVRRAYGLQPASPPPDGQRFIKLVVMPELSKLALRRDHRVFQKVNALQIVREVFRSAGVYGFLPDVPLIGEAMGGLSAAAGYIPFVGSAMGDAISGQFIRTIPPTTQIGSLAQNDDASVPSPMPEAEWTMEREMCVQYGETDLDFVRRLLEEEGIHFTFEHRRGFERIVLAHDPARLDEAPTVDGKPVRFRWPMWGDSMAVESVWRGSEKLRLNSTKITLHDYTMSSGTQTPTARFAPTSAPIYGERFEYPGSFAYQYDDNQDPAIHYRDYTTQDDRDMAYLRLEEQASEGRRVRLFSDAIGIESGRTIKLRGFPFQRDGQLLDPAEEPPKADLIIVDRVRWRGGIALAGLGNGILFPVAPTIAEVYENEITGWWKHPKTPRNTPVRPPRKTPKPKIVSLQTATVVDSMGDHDEDEEVQYDDRTLARVLVRFHWDRRGEMPLGLNIPLPRLDGDISNIDEWGRGTTCWVRVAHTWAGDDYGVHFVPRIGSEVVIAFENGDPDRPYVVGCLYDGEHPMPLPGRETKRNDFTPPETKPLTVSTIMTRTSPWDDEEGVVSELTFDDDKGKERILLKAGRYLLEEVRGAQTTTVGNDQWNEVGRDHGEIVEQKQILEVGGSREKTVKTDHLVEVRGRRESTVGTTQTVVIESQHAEKIEKTVDLHVIANRTLNVHCDRVTKVGKKDPPGQEPQHDLHNVKGTKTDTITGALEVIAGTLSVGQQGDGPDSPDTAIEAGPSKKLDANGEPTVDVYALNVKAQKETASIEIKAQKEVKIVSKNESVTFYITAESELMGADGKIRMAESPDVGITMEHLTRIQIHTEKDVMLVTPESVRLAAQGDSPAVAEVTPSSVGITGRTGIVVATVDIRGFPDVMKMGE